MELAASAAVLALWISAGFADPSAPAIQERRQPPAEAFKKAIGFRADFPEAWNELGYALRNQGRYAESLDAYQEALRLRPDFPEALEYLGEAYVKMGQLDDARRVLERLRPLDPHRAEELDEAIKAGK